MPSICSFEHHLAFKLRDRTDDAPEQLAGRGVCLESHRQYPESHLLPLKLGHDRLQVRQGPRQTVELGHHEGVAVTHELDGTIQLQPGGERGNLFLEYLLAAVLRQLRLLSLEAGFLFLRGGSRIADQHGPTMCCTEM